MWASSSTGRPSTTSIVSKTPFAGSGCGGEGMPGYFEEMLLVRRIDELRTTPSGPSSTSAGTARTPSGWTAAAVSTSAPASPSSATAAGRSARSSPTTSARVRFGWNGTARSRSLRESIFDYLGRETRRLRRLCRRPAVRLRLRLRRLLRLRAEGGLRRRRRPRARRPPTRPSSSPTASSPSITCERRTYVLCVTEPDGAEEGERWIDETSQRLASLPPLPDPDTGGGGDGERAGRASTSAAPTSATSKTSPPASGACSRARPTRSA